MSILGWNQGGPYGPVGGATKPLQTDGVAIRTCSIARDAVVEPREDSEAQQHVRGSQVLRLKVASPPRKDRDLQPDIRSTVSERNRVDSGLCPQGVAMKRSRFTDEQIAFVLRHAESGVPVEEVCRKMSIGQQTFYRWKKEVCRPGRIRASSTQAIDPSGKSDQQELPGPKNRAHRGIVAAETHR